MSEITVTVERKVYVGKPVGEGGPGRGHAVVKLVAAGDTDKGDTYRGLLDKVAESVDYELGRYLEDPTA